MGARTSNLAKRVGKSRKRAISPRERKEMPTLSTGSPSLRHDKGKDMEGLNEKEQEKFREDWFPNVHWEQYPVRGDIQEMAQQKRSVADVISAPDPEIPSLAEEKDNQDLIRDLTFIGQGLTPGPDKATQFPRLHRDESKMPKQRISLPEKKLKGYLDANQFAEMYEWSNNNYTVEELSLKFETMESQIEKILAHTEWVQQPPSSILEDPKQTLAAEDKQRQQQQHEQNVNRLHMPNQGGDTPFEDPRTINARHTTTR